MRSPPLEDNPLVADPRPIAAASVGALPAPRQLMGQIGQALGAAGLPTKLEDDFHPHVTIGRARTQKVPGVKKVRHAEGGRGKISRIK